MELPVVVFFQRDPKPVKLRLRRPRGVAWELVRWVLEQKAKGLETTSMVVGERLGRCASPEQAERVAQAWRRARYSIEDFARDLELTPRPLDGPATVVRAGDVLVACVRDWPRWARHGHPFGLEPVPEAADVPLAPPRRFLHPSALRLAPRSGPCLGWGAEDPRALELVPPRSYTCAKCGAIGHHFASRCFYTREEAWVVTGGRVRKLGLPGVPQKLMRAPRTEFERAAAGVDGAGRMRVTTDLLLSAAPWPRALADSMPREPDPDPQIPEFLVVAFDGGGEAGDDGDLAL